MIKQPFYVALLCWLLSAASAAWATEHSVSASLAAGFTHVDYRELDDDNNVLDRETGILPGVELGLSYHHRRFFIDAQLSAFAETITYDGQTQMGAPHITQSDTHFYALSTQTGVWLNSHKSLAVHLHLAAQQWDRDIYPTNTVQGLFERYRWLEAGLGARWQWRQQQTNQWGQETQLTLFATTQHNLLVKLSQLQGSMHDITLHPKTSFGFRVKHDFQWALSNQRQLFIQPQLAAWHFGKSDTGTVYNGSQRVYIHEPRSVTWRIGLMAGVRW